MNNPQVNGNNLLQQLIAMGSTASAPQSPTLGTVNAPQAPTLGNGGLGAMFKGMNLQDIMGGLGGLASLYMGNKQLGLVKDQYNTNKAFGNANLVNQSKDYNRNLNDMYAKALAAKQGVANNGGLAPLAEYMAKNALNETPIA